MSTIKQVKLPSAVSDCAATAGKIVLQLGGKGNPGKKEVFCGIQGRFNSFVDPRYKILIKYYDVIAFTIEYITSRSQ